MSHSASSNSTSDKTFTSVVDLTAVRTYLLGLQQNIVTALEQAGGDAFQRDEWTRAEGGGGISRLIEGGSLFERAGVLFSHVKGMTLPPPRHYTAQKSRGDLGKPWASPWCCTRAIPTSRRRI